MTDHDQQQPDGDEPVSWAEHAEGLEGAQLALALVRAYLTDDEGAELAAVTAPLEEQLAAGDYGQVANMETHLVRLVIQFGQGVHGPYLDAVLGQMQRDLADHIADYRPDDQATDPASEDGP